MSGINISGLALAFQGQMNIGAGSGAVLKSMIFPDSFTPLQSHSTKSQCTEISGSGYTPGGLTLSSLPTISVAISPPWTVTIVVPEHTFPAFTASNLGGIIIYRDTGNAATSPLLCNVNFTPVSRTNQTLRMAQTVLTWNHPEFTPPTS